MVHKFIARTGGVPLQRLCLIPSYRVVIVTTLFFYTDVQLGTTLPAALLGKVPTIGAVEELGSKEGQGVSKAEAPQQQALAWYWQR